MHYRQHSNYDIIAIFLIMRILPFLLERFQKLKIEGYTVFLFYCLQTLHCTLIQHINCYLYMLYSYSIGVTFLYSLIGVPGIF